MLNIRWRDGFSIDGGELRHYSDPGSREFMVDLHFNSVCNSLIQIQFSVGQSNSESNLGMHKLLI